MWPLERYLQTYVWINIKQPKMGNFCSTAWRSYCLCGQCGRCNKLTNIEWIIIIDSLGWADGWWGCWNNKQRIQWSFQRNKFLILHVPAIHTECRPEKMLQSYNAAPDGAREPLQGHHQSSFGWGHHSQAPASLWLLLSCLKHISLHLPLCPPTTAPVCQVSTVKICFRLQGQVVKWLACGLSIVLVTGNLFLLMLWHVTCINVLCSI